MTAQIAIYAVIGGVIPDVLRLLKWLRTSKGDRGANPLADWPVYVAMLLQGLLGVFAAYVLVVSTPLQAAAVGYAAPDVLSRVLSGAAKSSGKHLGDRGGALRRLIDWWRF
jgi:hypothetical protein